MATMVNPELRRQVVNVYKGMVGVHTQIVPSRVARLTRKIQNSYSLGENIPWDTSTSGTDSIVRLRDKRICATRSKFGRGLLGRSL